MRRQRPEGDLRSAGAQYRVTPKSTRRVNPQIRMTCEEEIGHVLPTVENAMYPILDITVALYEWTRLRPQSQEEVYNQARTVEDLLAQLKRTAALGEDANVRLSKKYGGGTCLHLATLTGSLQCVSILVSAGARVEAKDANRQTALHWAANSATFPIIRFLCKVSKSLTQQRDILANLPIHYAAQRGDSESFTYLAGFTSPRCVGHNRKTLLHMACQRGATDIILQLLKASADPSACSNQGTTALHYAASRGNAKAAKILVNVAPHLVRVRDCHGRTPLELAFHRGTLTDDINRVLKSHARSVSPRITSRPTHTSPCAASRVPSRSVSPRTLRASPTPQSSKRSITPRMQKSRSTQVKSAPSMMAQKRQARSTPSIGIGERGRANSRAVSPVTPHTIGRRIPTASRKQSRSVSPISIPTDGITRKTSRGMRSTPSMRGDFKRK